LNKKIYDRKPLCSEAKVANFMIKKNISNFNKLSDIANSLNLVPETLSRIITTFKKESIIECKNAKLEILNIYALILIVETNSSIRELKRKNK